MIKLQTKQAKFSKGEILSTEYLKSKDQVPNTQRNQDPASLAGLQAGAK